MNKQIMLAALQKIPDDVDICSFQITTNYGQIICNGKETLWLDFSSSTYPESSSVQENLVQASEAMKL